MVFMKAHIYTDFDESETKIKAMSAKGQLIKYKIIHFASHGLVAQQNPALSALVLSQVIFWSQSQFGIVIKAERGKWQFCRSAFFKINSLNLDLKFFINFRIN